MNRCASNQPAPAEPVPDGQVLAGAREPIGRVCAECGWVLPPADEADVPDDLVMLTNGTYPDQTAARRSGRDVTNRSRQMLEAVARQLASLWAGLVIGVSFLATPAKFMAPSLSLAAALDVGRQTFFILNCTELVLGAVLAVLGCSAARSFRSLVWVVPGSIVLLQTVWLLPFLDARVEQVLGGDHPPGSALHIAYVALELVKVGALLALAVVACCHTALNGGLLHSACLLRDLQRQQTRSEQLGTSPAIHSPLQRLQLVDLALSLPAAPALGDGVPHRFQVSAQHPGETLHGADPGRTSVAQPIVELRVTLPLTVRLRSKLGEALRHCA